MGALRQNITDRGLRYRANRAIPDHAKVCAFCGKRGGVEVGHVNGDESDTLPVNLTWTCRPCNVVAGNTLRNAGRGRLTNQYNPGKGGGASNVGEWMNAVGAITPHVDRGNRGLASTMSVGDAVAMIRATPHSRRSEFAARLRRRNPFFLSVPVKTKAKKRSGLTVAQATAEARKLGFRGGDFREWLEKKHLDERGPLVIDRFGDAYRAGIDDRDNQDQAKEAKRKTKRSGGASPVVAAKDLDQAALAAHYARGGTLGEFLKANPARKKKRNPADGAAEAFEDFHGHPSTEVVTVKKKVHQHKHLAAAGELRALEVAGIDGKHHLIKGFKGAILAFNESRNQLFVEGGDQSLNLADFGIKKPRELEELGKLTNIDYFTTKTHLGDEGGTAIYQHGFRMTNKDGKHVIVKIARYPTLLYRVLDEQFEFAGGSYTIKREGIDL